MPPTVNFHGDTSAKQQPGTPLVVQGVSFDEATIEVAGNTSEVRNYYAPNQNVLVNVGGYVKSMMVESYTVKPRQANGLAVGTARLSNRSMMPDPIYECEFCELDKDLLTHPIFQPNGTYALDVPTVLNIQSWQAETNVFLSANFQFHYDSQDKFSTIYTLPNAAQYYAQKYLAGTKSYLVCYPIATATTYSMKKPTLGQVDVLQRPPTACPVPTGNWVWRLAADRSRYNKRFYTRERRWIGARKWDADLYPWADTPNAPN